MTRQAFCTYFDRRYLPRGLVLYDSLREHAGDVELWVFALDDETLEALKRLALPGLVPVGLDELEAWDPALPEVRPSRSLVEYYFTLTPDLPRFVFARSEAEIVSYVDADLRFYSNPEPVLGLLQGKTALIVPHGFPDRLARLRSHGTFNVGLVGFRRSAEADACLARWRAQCLEWCYDRVEDGRFADQAYLNDWPEKVPGVVVVDRPGVGLAPWNFMRYSIDSRTNPPTVSGDALVFYHFHALRQLTASIWDTGLAEYGAMPGAVRRALYDPYIDALNSARAHLAHDAAGTPGLQRGSTPFRRLLRGLIARQLIIRSSRRPRTGAA